MYTEEQLKELEKQYSELLKNEADNGNLVRAYTKKLNSLRSELSKPNLDQNRKDELNAEYNLWMKAYANVQKGPSPTLSIQSKDDSGKDQQYQLMPNVNLEQELSHFMNATPNTGNPAEDAKLQDALSQISMQEKLVKDNKGKVTARVYVVSFPNQELAQNFINHMTSKNLMKPSDNPIAFAKLQQIQEARNIPLPRPTPAGTVRQNEELKRQPEQKRPTTQVQQQEQQQQPVQQQEPMQQQQQEQQQQQQNVTNEQPLQQPQDVPAAEQTQQPSTAPNPTSTAGPKPPTDV